jgi:hypothetical protein
MYSRTMYSLTITPVQNIRDFHTLKNDPFISINTRDDEETRKKKCRNDEETRKKRH